MRIFLVFLSSIFLLSYSAVGNEYNAQIDPFTMEKATDVIRSRVIPARHETIGVVIDAVSASFIATPYRAHTLIGSPTMKERLVANFNGVDCFTLLDYVRALSLSRDYNDFLNALVATRYIDGRIGYLTRKHFFSDWAARVPANANDVTDTISKKYVTVKKQLNRKPDGGEYIKGLGFIARNITYIPGKNINRNVLDKLKTGDFVGVYSSLDGLDVSHVGIAIKHKGKVFFRNASSLSRNMKVVDTPFMAYMANQPGIVVLRMNTPGAIEEDQYDY